MKKVLLGTSAIALASAYTTQANAAEWDVRVGGYFESFVAYSQGNVDFAVGATGGSIEVDGVDVKQDAEIHFKPSITLDNGIKIGVDIQLEGNTSGDTIDESFLQIKGSFGEVLLGSENSAGYKMTFAAPDVTFINVNSGSTTAFVPWATSVGGVTTGSDVFRATLGTTFLENDANNDAQRITYFTPRFAGFQVGASYARDVAQDSSSQEDLDGVGTANIVDFGANYVNSFGDFDLALSGRYGVAFGDAGDDPTIYSFGGNFGFAGVTIGGSFAEQNNTALRDGTSWDVGISYETGPWGFSFTYFNGENVDNDGINSTLGADEEVDQYLVGMNYKLAKGVSLGGYAAYIDFDEDIGDLGDGTAGNDTSGFLIGTGIKVSF